LLLSKSADRTLIGILMRLPAGAKKEKAVA
jgi:hypothetical protein